MSGNSLEPSNAVHKVAPIVVQLHHGKTRARYDVAHIPPAGWTWRHELHLANGLVSMVGWAWPVLTRDEAETSACKSLAADLTRHHLDGMAALVVPNQLELW